MALTQMLPQGPNRHCGNANHHDRHVNLPVDGSWCDGIPLLPPFYELTIRLPLEVAGGIGAGASHQQALDYLQEWSLRVILDMVSDAQTVLRVRTTDGVDKVYPVVAGRNGGFSAVVDAPPPFGDVQS